MTFLLVYQWPGTEWFGVARLVGRYFLLDLERHYGHLALFSQFVHFMRPFVLAGPHAMLEWYEWAHLVHFARYFAVLR